MAACFKFSEPLWVVVSQVFWTEREAAMLICGSGYLTHSQLSLFWQRRPIRRNTRCEQADLRFLRNDKEKRIQSPLLDLELYGNYFRPC